MSLSFPPPRHNVSHWVSSFTHSKSSHSKLIESNYFNTQIDIILPETNQKSQNEILEKLNFSYYTLNATLSSLLTTEFIDTYVRSGTLVGYTLNAVDHSPVSVAFLPAGKILLAVDTDTYHSLGLTGELVKLSTSVHRYDILIDAAPVSFRPGKKYYERVMWCLGRLPAFRFHMLWTHNGRVMPINFPSDVENTVSHVEITENVLGDIHVPTINPLINTNTGMYTEVYDYLGLVANECLDVLAVDRRRNEYISTFTLKEAEYTAGRLRRYRLTGFLSSESVMELIRLLSESLSVGTTPWISLTVHGSVCAAIARGRPSDLTYVNEHSLYTFVLFPENSYWLYEAKRALEA